MTFFEALCESMLYSCIKSYERRNKCVTAMYAMNGELLGKAEELTQWMKIIGIGDNGKQVYSLNITSGLKKVKYLVGGERSLAFFPIIKEKRSL